ncbi:VpaChn25_0724 family phage protein [Litoreibacter roseus]|uniref:ArsR family transcriptional regulator n=1 Tax=Litoreibacter roseus TaxID=2601869 RepID=A0A6N6JNX0_9RHOB|nr:ArsR family transcriptional regulator [Litoreibacter roseus]GFE67102.1 hypothetical protein KIN_41760 [Litoreibacter roseus]
MKNAEDQMDSIKRQHRALAILRLLERNPGYCTNIELLRDCLAVIALTATRDQLLQECRSLESVGFLRVTERGEVVVLELTEAGGDVAQGLVMSDLVLRPGPECPY